MIYKEPIVCDWCGKSFVEPDMLNIQDFMDCFIAPHCPYCGEGVDSIYDDAETIGG